MASLQLKSVLSLPAAVRSQAWRRAILESSSWTERSRTVSRRLVGSSRQYTSSNASKAPVHSSVNHDEVSHFSALASSWWDPYGSSRLLHLMNPLRHKFLRQCRETQDLHPNRKLRYLDVGCGGGIFAESAARLSSTKSVTAIDPTPEVIAVAKQHQRQDPLLLQPALLEYRNTAIEELPTPPLPEKGYDIITLFEVIEHIRKPSPFLRSCLAHLKPGGWLVGSTIARTNTSWFTTKLMAEDVLGLVPRGTHEWNQYIQPNELRSWARAQPELEIEGSGWQVMGVLYVPGLGWKEMSGSEEWGNYFFGMRKRDAEE